MFYIFSYDTKIAELYSSDPEKYEVALLARDTFDCFVTATEGTSDIFHPSAEMDYVECKGNLYLGWKTGFGTFIDFLTGKRPKSSQDLCVEEKVLLNKEVVKIIWTETVEADDEEIMQKNDLYNEGSTNQSRENFVNGYAHIKNIKQKRKEIDPNVPDNKIQVVFSDGNKINVNFLVFTPSLGVLKEKQEEMFEPKLPRKKLEVIEELGFGGLIKFAMEFEENWWNSDNFKSVGLVWREEDKRRITEQILDGPKEVTLIRRFICCISTMRIFS